METSLISFKLLKHSVILFDFFFYSILENFCILLKFIESVNLSYNLINKVACFCSNQFKLFHHLGEFFGVGIKNKTNDCHCILKLCFKFCLCFFNLSISILLDHSLVCIEHSDILCFKLKNLCICICISLLKQFLLKFCLKLFNLSCCESNYVFLSLLNCVFDIFLKLFIACNLFLKLCKESHSFLKHLGSFINAHAQFAGDLVHKLLLNAFKNNYRVKLCLNFFKSSLKLIELFHNDQIIIDDCLIRLLSISKCFFKRFKSSINSCCICLIIKSRLEFFLSLFKLASYTIDFILEITDSLFKLCICCCNLCLQIRYSLIESFICSVCFIKLRNCKLNISNCFFCFAYSNSILIYCSSKVLKTGFKSLYSLCKGFYCFLSSILSNIDFFSKSIDCSCELCICCISIVKSIDLLLKICNLLCYIYEVTVFILEQVLKSCYFVVKLFL